jgi:hypothetical protein
VSALDARGCLTDQALAALASAPVGGAPPEVASHLARCARCQDRLLRSGREPGDGRPASSRAPFRNLAIVGALLLITLVMLGITLGVLRGR